MLIENTQTQVIKENIKEREKLDVKQAAPTPFGKLGEYFLMVE
ncbi:MAG: hypothetical protein AAES65_22110 [Candidatus Thiodiazotropha sp. (ex. Lucinoma kazani)]